MANGTNGALMPLGAGRRTTAVVAVSATTTALLLIVIMTSMRQTNDEKKKKPYSKWSHPHKSWSDKLLSNLIIPMLVPLHKIAKHEPNVKNEATQKFMTNLRSRMQAQAKGPTKNLFQQWKKETRGGDLVEICYRLPRTVQLLKEWGIVTNPDTIQILPGPNAYPTDDILVKFVFPAVLLEGLSNEKGEPWLELAAQPSSDMGLRTVPLETADDMANLLGHISSRSADKVPLVVSLHGGGLIFGDAYAGDVVDVCVRAVQEYNNGGSNKSSVCPLIMASIEYSLTPEYQFPVAIEEALQVTDHLLALSAPYKNIQVHMQGNSAGAYLTALATLEFLRRRRPNGLASAMMMCPMMDPSCDSQSYYLNSKMPFVPVSMIKWCWQSYIPLDSGFDNRTAWTTHCPYKDTELERLIHPTCKGAVEELQQALLLESSTADSPPTRVLLCTNRGDPLHDEDMEFCEKLQEIAENNPQRLSATHFDHDGSHHIGTIFNSKHYKEVVEAWSQELFE